MYNFVICEDNYTTGEILKEYISEYATEKNLDFRIHLFRNNFLEVAAFADSNVGDINVYFLDIILNQDNATGLSLAREIRKIDVMAYIIFITSHPELSLKVFQYKLKALDYIYKHDDNIQTRIKECIDSIMDEVKQLGNMDPTKQIILKSMNDFYTVNPADIVYFETRPGSRLLNCVLSDGTNVEFYDTLKNINKQLDNRFCHCHRSFIINIRHIRKLGNEKPYCTVTMSNGKVCDVSKAKWRDLINRVRA